MAAALLRLVFFLPVVWTRDQQLFQLVIQQQTVDAMLSAFQVNAPPLSQGPWLLSLTCRWEPFQTTELLVLTPNLTLLTLNGIHGPPLKSVTYQVSK